ncbi:unnamed protein product, partial [Meganyctiphanes norvegica]
KAFKTNSALITVETESKLSASKNDEVCNVHCKETGHWCFKCQIWICDDCLQYHTNKMGCSTLESAVTQNKELESLKDKYINDIDTLLSKCGENANFLSSRLEKQTQLAEKHNTEAKKLSSMLEEGKLHREKLIDLRKLLDSQKSLRTVCDTMKVVEQIKHILISWSVNNKEIGSTQDLIKALEDTDVYAEMSINGEQRLATLSQHGESVYVHQFVKKEKPNGCICMPFDRIQMMIPEAPLVFVELKVGSSVKIINIRLDKNLPNIRDNFVHIVTGQGKSVLRGLKLNGQNGYNSHEIYVSSLPFSEMKFTCDRSVTCTAKRGDIIGRIGEGYLSQLHFYVPPSSQTHNYASHGGSWCVFGHIEDTFDAIQECCQNYSKGVTISDCGLILDHE